MGEKNLFMSILCEFANISSFDLMSYAISYCPQVLFVAFPCFDWVSLSRQTVKVGRAGGKIVARPSQLGGFHSHSQLEVGGRF